MHTVWVDLDSGTYGSSELAVIEVTEEELTSLDEMSDLERIEWAEDRRDKHI